MKQRTFIGGNTEENTERFTIQLNDEASPSCNPIGGNKLINITELIDVMIVT
jgi:hypothetical protein